MIRSAPVRAAVLFSMGLLTSLVSASKVSFDVDVGAGKLDGAKDGRLIVFIVGPNHPLMPGQKPADWDYCHVPMPLYAIDVKQLASGGQVKIDEKADHYMTTLDALPAGRYSAQAVFDWQSLASGWQMEPGNLSSSIETFDVKPESAVAVALHLTKVVKAPNFDRPGMGRVQIRSKLLSDFAHHDVMLSAGIALPIDYDATKKYAAIYEVLGFGGTDADAMEEAQGRAHLAKEKPSDQRTLASKTFHILLNPESPNGHTLFANSDVNGPYGKALVEELIPAIEKQYPALVSEPWARLLTGHSSGGYSVCWLQTQYDAAFGGAWPSSPDPLDFHRFELIDIYHQDNFYSVDGNDLPADRDGDGKVTLSARDENAWEETVCPNNNGGQQWQSWEAVFGLPRGDGHPKSLYDIRTGVIDKSQIDHYARYDLDGLLQKDPAKYAPIWREKIRLIVGDADDYYLHEAVKLVAETLAKLPPTGTPETNLGYVKIVPGKTHDTIYETPEMDAFDTEMLKAIDAKLK